MIKTLKIFFFSLFFLVMATQGWHNLVSFLLEENMNAHAYLHLVTARYQISICSYSKENMTHKTIHLLVAK